MNLQEIETYLQEMGKILPRHLKSLGLPDRPLRLLAFGGVFMAHMHYRSSTHDLDIQFLDFLSIAEERAEKKGITLPTHAFMSAAQEVARTYKLRHDWVNDDASIFIEMYLDKNRRSSYMIPWKRFGLIHIFFPTLECQLTLKILAGRPKDLPDVMALRHALQLFSREETLHIIDAFIDPQLQEVFFRTLNVEAFIHDLY